MGQRTEESIEKFKNAFEAEDKWNWDDNWDGKIERLCNQLGDMGLEVSHIYRKGKVQVQWPKLASGNREHKGTIWSMLGVMANDIKELTFTGNKILIHFDMGVPIKRSRRI